MKIHELAVGQIVDTRFGLAVILDIGKFERTNNDRGHRVTVHGQEFLANHYWYTPDPNLAQRRVVFGLLKDGLVMEVNVDTPQSIRYIYPDEHEGLRTRLVSMVAQRDLNAEIVRRNERVQDSERVISEVMFKATGTEVRQVDYWARNGMPWTIPTANKEVLQQMTLLWLRYHEEAGAPLPNGESAEGLADAFRDAVKAWRYARESAGDRDRIIQETAVTRVAAGWTNALQVVPA